MTEDDSASPHEDDREVRSWVENYYGEVLQSSADLKTSACCAVAPPPWLQGLLARVHPEVQERFYGCGFPLPEGLEGRTVLDLGCGTGRDVFLLAQLVGPKGRVHGVDMTPAQLEVGRRHVAWHAAEAGLSEPNVEFHHGYIEDLTSLGLAPGSIDACVSNCVVNLSPRKDLVLAQAYEMLAPGGEFYLSDVVVDRRLDESAMRDPELVGECLGGALYRHDMEDLARATGFLDPRVVEVQPIAIESAGVREKIGAARFFSVTYRLFKLPALEPRCEDYGEVAVYKGGIPHHEALFRLDDHHAFERGRPERVCGNTADMLTKTRLGAWFEVYGDRETHYGRFECAGTMASEIHGDTAASDSCC
ncbi:MAG: methyltransferase domain-containing protein [Myxococcota bacterium]|nr:methyltransferase domain-containing protein [Myxococcota bacterium]